MAPANRGMPSAPAKASRSGQSRFSVSSSRRNRRNRANIVASAATTASCASIVKMRNCSFDRNRMSSGAIGGDSAVTDDRLSPV